MSGPPRLRVYVDTSVVSAYFDAREPHRMEATREKWTGLKPHSPCISADVLVELHATRDDQLRAKMLALVGDLHQLAWNQEAAILVQNYLAEGVFTPALLADARHVAIATVHRVPIMLSWNFRHLVNRSRRLRVNLVNSLLGHEQIEILAPPELA